jgi:hypothetical protein
MKNYGKIFLLLNLILFTSNEIILNNEQKWKIALIVSNALLHRMNDFSLMSYPVKLL